MTKTLLFMDGLDYGATIVPPWKWSGGLTASMAGRFGGYARSSTSNGSATAYFEPVNMFDVGFASYKPSTQQQALIRVYSGSTIMLELYVGTDGAISIWRGSTLLATSTLLMTLPGLWHHIEFRGYIHDTAGRAQVYVDGVLFIDFSGNTRNGTPTTVSSIYTNSVLTHQHYIDDVYVFGLTDFVNDPLTGDCRIFTLSPGGAGNYAQWTPSAGENHAAVDEEYSDGDTTYVGTDTIGALDSYAFGDIAGSGDVVGACLNLIGRKDDAGVRTIAPMYRRGSDYFGSDANPSDSYNIFPWIMQVDPATSAAWTLANINAAEFGVKLVA